MQAYSDQILPIYYRLLRRGFLERSVSRLNTKCSYNAGDTSQHQLCVPSLNKTRYSRPAKMKFYILDGIVC